MLWKCPHDKSSFIIATTKQIWYRMVGLYFLTLASLGGVSSSSVGYTWIISGCRGAGLLLEGICDLETRRARPPEGSSNSSVSVDIGMVATSWGAVRKMARWQEMTAASQDIRGGGMADLWRLCPPVWSRH